MTRRASLKPHLSQIRDWAAQGATDIWIAHTLGSTPASIAAFRRQHGLTRPPAGEAVAVAMAAPTPGHVDTDQDEVVDEGVDEGAAADDEPVGPATKRRRRRGGRGRSRRSSVLAGVVDEATGIRIDEAGLRDPRLAPWLGADVEIRVGADELTIRRPGASDGDADA